MYGKQMELFEEGGEVDEVSGNNIPLGSTAEEVRDDQPAMLSEGEMVIPADVVRYFGVEYFMSLRDQAKIGYKKMEAMGQFGTEKGQTLPDDTLFNAGGPPFTIEDIEIIEDYEEDEPEEKKSIEAAEGALITDDSKAEPNYLTKLGKQVAFDFKNVEDIVGVDVFNYLKSFLPKDILKSGTEEEIKAAQNYSNNLTANLGISSTATTESGGGGGEGPSETSGLPSVIGVGSTAQGTGDINTLMSYPTTANINGLKSFASLLDTTFGKSVLGAFGFMTSLAINPGQVAPVVGMVQRGVGMLERGLTGTSKISDAFSALRDIPTIQANMANRAARSFAYDMQNLSKVDKDNIDAVFSMQQYADNEGYGSLIDNPNVTIGITTRGEVVGKFSQGPFAATYNARGEIIGDKWGRTLTPEEIKEAMERGYSFVNNAKFAADPNTSYSKSDPGVSLFGGWGGPVDPNSAIGGPSDGSASGGRGNAPADLSPTFDIGRAMNPNFGLPDDDDIDYDNKIDYGGMTGAESVLGGGDADPGGMTGAGVAGAGGYSSGSDLEGYSDTGGFDEGGGDDGGADGGTGGDGSPGADTDAGNEGGMKAGGLIKKRNTQKKNKRRGLAGR